jgi:hypothetical protein
LDNAVVLFHHVRSSRSGRDVDLSGVVQHLPRSLLQKAIALRVLIDLCVKRLDSAHQTQELVPDILLDISSVAMWETVDENDSLFDIEDISRTLSSSRELVLAVITQDTASKFSMIHAVLCTMKMDRSLITGTFADSHDEVNHVEFVRPWNKTDLGIRRNLWEIEKPVRKTTLVRSL